MQDIGLIISFVGNTTFRELRYLIRAFLEGGKSFVFSFSILLIKPIKEITKLVEKAAKAPISPNTCFQQDLK